MRTGLALFGAALVALGVGGGAAQAVPSLSPNPALCLGSVSHLCSGRAELAFGVDSGAWKTDFGRATVPLDEFLSGGPGKDGIAAIDRPRFARADGVRFLRPREPVIELVVRGEARAYPLQILIWHEIANDRVAGTPVAVTFCPLCNTALVFDRRVRGRTLSFGTTGLLRNSDLVMYDRQTESWWQQFGGEGIVGRYAGTRLRALPARIVSWADFRRAHPDGLVLTRDTGLDRPYGRSPYRGYDDADSPPWFAVAHGDDERLSPKERVVFLERGGKAAVVPFTVLERRREVEVELGGRTLLVHWLPGVTSPFEPQGFGAGPSVGSAEVLEDGRPVASEQPFWFAVAAFRPDVEIVGERPSLIRRVLDAIAAALDRLLPD